jgi:hypothetical protein
MEARQDYFEIFYVFQTFSQIIELIPVPVYPHSALVRPESSVVYRYVPVPVHCTLCTGTGTGTGTGTA